MTTDDEQPGDGDRREAERAHKPRVRTQRPERHADLFPAPMTPSRN